MIRCFIVAVALCLSVTIPFPASAQQFTGDKQYVRANTLRVRGDANLEAEVIDRLTAGHPVYVLITTEGWAFIEYSRDGGPDRFRGWVSAEYVR